MSAINPPMKCLEISKKTKEVFMDDFYINVCSHEHFLLYERGGISIKNTFEKALLRNIDSYVRLGSGTSEDFVRIVTESQKDYLSWRRGENVADLVRKRDFKKLNGKAIFCSNTEYSHEEAPESTLYRHSAIILSIKDDFSEITLLDQNRSPVRNSAINIDKGLQQQGGTITKIDVMINPRTGEVPKWLSDFYVIMVDESM